MTRMIQPDLFGGEVEHLELEKRRRERERNERLRGDPDYARRSLILNCLNRRGPMPSTRISELLGLAASLVELAISDLRQKGLVVEVGTEDHAWVWRATAKWEEVA